MRRIASIALGWAAFAALPIGAAAQPTDLPRSPSSKWVVEYADSECVLSRDYGEGSDRLTFAIRILPLSPGVTLALLMPDRDKGKVREGKAKAVLSSGETIDSDYRSASSAGGAKTRVVRFGTTQAEIKALSSTKTLSIALDQENPIVLQMGGLGAGLKAIDLCEIDLLKSWGIDPAVRGLVPEMIGDGRWFSHKDYPSEAIRRRLRGNTTILWKVDLEGRVVECRTVQSSGHAVLDQAACDGLMKRGRYHPARNGDGQPTIAWMAHIVRWLIP